MTFVSSLISLLSFCLADLFISESRMLKSPTITVWGLVCDLSFSNFFFKCVFDLVSVSYTQMTLPTNSRV